MRRYGILLEWYVMLMATAAHAAGELQCVQRPMFFIVGQENRYVIDTPPDCGELVVTLPPGLQLVDRWPYRAGDTRQRFYIRADRPVSNAAIIFSAGNYLLSVPVEVLTWNEVLQPRELGGIKLPRVFPIQGQDEPKTGPSFLPPDALDALRAAGSRGAGVLPPDEQAWFGLPETTVPRAVFVQYYNPKGCPICGRKIFEGRSPFYPWLLDFEGHPWKVGCPECGRWFPSNDYAAGDRHTGEFPDDGWGYLRDGDPYGFISYYAQAYYRMKHNPDLFSFADQYARTGDRRYGHAAALMMFRTAEQYLNLALNINQRKRHTRYAVWEARMPPQNDPEIVNSWFYIEHNWECPLVPQYAAAFDKIWSYFDEEDPELLRFLQAHHHPEIQTLADVRRFIETGYFRVVGQGCLDRALIGNHPQAQRAALEVALSLNTPRCREIVDWVFDGRGGMRYFLTNEFFIDGSAFESQGYNTMHILNVQGIADVLDRIIALRPQEYEKAGFPILSRDPKYKQLYDFAINYSLIGRTHAQIGDCGSVASTDPLPLHPCSDLSRSDYVAPFTKFPADVQFAKVLWDPKLGEPIPQLTDPALRSKVQDTIQQEGKEIELPSNFLDGYGHAILRSGAGDDRRALWVRYGQAYSHVHDDLLTIGYEAKQRKLLPELGYPRGWANTGRWEANWATHYCARIIGKDPAVQLRGKGTLQLFADGGWAQVAAAAARPYRNLPPPRLCEPAPEVAFERTIGLVDLSPTDSYAFSIFRLSGGAEHYLSFHGPLGRATPSGISLTAQPRGTLAGSEVPYLEGGKWAADHPDLAAFPCLYDVQRGQANGPWAVDWELDKYPQVHLRMTALAPTDAEVALAKGKPPGGGDPYELQWAFQHTTADQPPNHTQLITLLEAYEGQRSISEARPQKVAHAGPLEQPPVAFSVTSGQRQDTIVQCHVPGLPARADNGVELIGSLGIWSEVDGILHAAMLVNGVRLAKGDVYIECAQPAWDGEIAFCDFVNRKVTIRPAHPLPDLLVGQQLRITNGANDCSHRILAARPVSQGTELSLEWDPRIGEGPVLEVRDGCLVSEPFLILGAYHYYRGKTLSNETGSTTYRITGVTDSSTVWIDPALHDRTTADDLKQAFRDADLDGVTRFVIYDYGPGDKVSVPAVVSVERNESGRYRLRTNAASVRTNLPLEKPGREDRP